METIRRLRETERMISLTKDVLKHDKDSHSLQLSLQSLEKMESRLKSECIRLGYGELIDGEIRLREGK